MDKNEFPIWRYPFAKNTNKLIGQLVENCFIKFHLDLLICKQCDCYIICNAIKRYKKSLKRF